MLDANLKTQLKAYLEKITRPIELVASLDDSAKSQELRALLDEIASLTTRVTVIERRDDEARRCDGSSDRRRPLGGPLGYWRRLLHVVAAVVH